MKEDNTKEELDLEKMTVSQLLNKLHLENQFGNLKAMAVWYMTTEEEDENGQVVANCYQLVAGNEIDVDALIDAGQRAFGEDD